VWQYVLSGSFRAGRDAIANDRLGRERKPAFGRRPAADHREQTLCRLLAYGTRRGHDIRASLATVLATFGL
jgi:hypothetical protein